MERHHFECACYSDEHTLKFVLDLEDEDPCIYVSSFLAAPSFWKRIRASIKYIFGYKCKFGHFEEYMMYEVSEALRLRELMDRFLAAKRAQMDQPPEPLQPGQA